MNRTQKLLERADHLRDEIHKQIAIDYRDGTEVVWLHGNHTRSGVVIRRGYGQVVIVRSAAGKEYRVGVERLQ